MARPSMNIDITSPEVRDAALTAFDSNSIPAQGKHIVTIDKAYVTELPGGSSWLNIHLKVENGKIYKVKQKCLMSGEAKGYEKTHAFEVLSNLLILTQSSGNAPKTPIKVTKFENGQAVEVEELLESYNDLVGKQVGAIIRCHTEYPTSLAIDGYTGRPIPDKSIDEAGYKAMKDLPSTVWMPNYSKEPNVVFDVLLYFDPETNKTLKELQDDNLLEGTEVNDKLEKLKKLKTEEEKLFGADWDKLRKKKLIARLKSQGEEFNASRFITSSSDASLEFEPSIGGEDTTVLYDYDDVE